MPSNSDSRPSATERPNKGMQLTVGAMVRGGAPPAADARRWADKP
jgi:hypothetical protein